MSSTSRMAVAALVVASAVWWAGVPATSAEKAKDEKKEPATRTSEKESFTEWGRATRTIVPPTDAGVWDGTWYYVSRDFIIAFWMKTENGIPKAKMQYSSLSSVESFVTDWDGNANYLFGKANANFSLNFTRRDANVIEGKWDWVLDVGKSKRVQEGTYKLYRSGDGRFMVLEFDHFEQRIEKKEGRDEVAQGDPSWTFKKASKRLVQWDELPF